MKPHFRLVFFVPFFCGKGLTCFSFLERITGGDRDQPMKEALGTMGASVFSGITITKLVGVIVLCFSRTEVFVVYYFQMYLALVLLGFLHGLVFFPVILSMFGPPSRYVPMERPQDQPFAASQPQP